MATPANNPFGAPPSQVLNNPFGAPAPAPAPAPASSQPAPAPNQQFQNPFGAAASQTNPFGSPAANPFGAPVKNPFGAPASGTKQQPSSGAASGAPPAPRSAFGSPAVSPGSSSRQLSPAPPLQLNNPFGTPPTGPKSSRSPSPSGSRAQPTEPSSRSSGSKSAEANTMARKNKSAGGKPAAPANSGGSGGQGGGQGTKGGAAGKGGSSNGGFGGRQGHDQGTQLANPFAGANPFAKQPMAQQPAGASSTQSRQNVRGKQQAGRQERHQPPSSSRASGQKMVDRGPTERTKELSSFAYDYANKLYDHLKKEGIHPPKWPADPGDPSKRAAIENLKEAYKKYRARVYASLRKADLIDDPEKRRKLEDALPFKGICESMCPEFEQVSRIAEYDVKTEEKELRPDGLTMWPDPAKMVKKFGRSAAGQDAPLPMDVRSVDALRRTTDYLFNDLLQSESNLPSMHNFLWDRTRAVRKDFTFHSQKSAEEMKDMVYCFETITRFHATALHLLSKKGVANEDFDQKQEIEQLGRTILSLIEAYDVCRDKRVHCENEAEFRAYYLLLNAHDPSIARRIPTWGAEFWFESEEVQTALSLIQAMDDVREPKGPIKPRVGTTLSDTSFTNYFAIVEDPRVSYTMACIAEIHFTSVRQAILRNLVRGYARHRDAPRTITASDLNAMLRFDTPDEAVEFAELHGFEFSTWVPDGRNPVTEPYLLLNNKKKTVPSPRVRQAFSGTLVERKRTTQSLPYVIYNTIFEEPAEKPPGGGSPDSLFSEDSGLFVTQTPASEPLAETNLAPLPPPPSKQSASPTTSSWSFGTPASSTPFSMGTSTTAPAFSGFSAPKPTASLFPGSSAASGQPTPQPRVGQSPFSSLSSQSAAAAAAAPTTITTTTIGTDAKPATTPAQVQPAPTEQTTTTSTTTASPFAPAKPTEGSSPFGFLKSSSSVPSLPNFAQPTQPQPSTTSPSVPSPLGNAAPKPTTTFGPSQDTATAQKKPPDSALSTSNLGSTNPPAGASPFPATTLPGQATQQSTASPSAVPTIYITPPSFTAPTTQGLQPPVPASPSKPFGQEPQRGVDAGATAPSTVAPKPPPPPKRDLLGDFTKWFVKGDDGLMEQFTEEFLRHILWGVWQDFEREREERKRKEEEKESWRLAREHQTYRLRLKYFYRWRNNARALATKRILREGREKMRLYREQQKEVRRRQQEEKEKADREAKRAAKRQLMEDTHRFSLLASSSAAAGRRRRGSVAYSADYVSNNDPEEQLLASGVFSGLGDDPRSLARRVVREAAGDADNEAWATGSATRSFRYPESELELELEPPRTSSPDTSSVGGGKREGWKTRSLREKFGLEPRRSLSAGGGSLSSLSSRFRQSLPGTNSRTTNFAASLSSSSRKRSAAAGGEESDDDPGARRLLQYGGAKAAAGSGLVRSTHWDLRARGFVPMPDGKWLPEALANKQLQQQQQQQQQQQGLGSPEDGLVDAAPDVDMASDAGRAASPTPSDWRLRLAKLKRYRPLAQHGHSSRHSVDLPQQTPTTTGLSTPPRGILSTSPPHPPFTSASAAAAAATATATIMQPPPLGGWRGEDGPIGGVGKRKRGPDDTGENEDEGHEDGAQQQRRSREPSPSAKKKAAAAAAAAAATGAVVVPGRAETYAMVENTKRMLRELREAMDRADRDAREEVY